MNEIDKIVDQIFDPDDVDLILKTGCVPLGQIKKRIKDQLTKYGQAQYERGWNDRQQCQEMTGDYDITGLRIKES